MSRGVCCRNSLSIGGPHAQPQRAHATAKGSRPTKTSSYLTNFRRIQRSSSRTHCSAVAGCQCVKSTLDIPSNAEEGSTVPPDDWATQGRGPRWVSLWDAWQSRCRVRVRVRARSSTHRPKHAHGTTDELCCAPAPFCACALEACFLNTLPPLPYGGVQPPPS